MPRIGTSGSVKDWVSSSCYLWKRHWTESNLPQIHAEIYKGVRRAPTRRFPYGIYYRFAEDSIVVIAVMHSRRDPRRWEERA